LRAADAAIATGAYSESTERLATALELGIADPRERARVQIELAHLLSHAGHRRPEAEALLARAAANVVDLEDRGIETRARLGLSIRRSFDAEENPQDSRAIAEEAIATFTELGDLRGLAEAWRHLGVALQRQGLMVEATDAKERAVSYGQGLGARLVQIAGPVC